MKNKIIIASLLIIVFLALLSISNNAYAATKTFTPGTTYYWGESISLTGTIYYYDDDHTWTKRKLSAGALGDEYYLDEELVKYDSGINCWSINVNPDEPLYGFFIFLGSDNLSNWVEINSLK